MASVDRQPDLTRQIRGLSQRIAELERAQLNAVRAAGFLSPAIASVTCNPFSAGSGSLIGVTFTTATLDTAGAFFGAGIGVRTPRAGVYVIFGRCQFAASASGDRFLSVATSAGKSAESYLPAPADPARPANMNATLLANCAAGESISMTVMQNSGSALTVSAVDLTLAWLGVGP